MSSGAGAILDAALDGPVLIVCPSWVGDTVMATPVFRAMQARLPRARLIGLMRPGLEEVLEGTSWLDEVIVARGGGMLGLREVVRAIRRAKPQAAVLLPNSFRSALGVWMTRVPVRIGYARDGRGMLLTHALAVQKSTTPQPLVPYYARIAEFALGVDAIERCVELACSDAQREAAARLVPLDEVKSKLIVLNPGANRESKRWPAERFAKVGDALLESCGAAIAVTGSPAEREVVERVCRASAHRSAFINLIERGVTLGSVKAIIERADLLITNDTGPRHLAIALGTPVVALFGPTDHRWTTIEGANERRLVAEPFLPEEMMADRFEQLCAVDRIPVSDVIVAAHRLLRL